MEPRDALTAILPDEEPSKSSCCKVFSTALPIITSRDRPNKMRHLFVLKFFITLSQVALQIWIAFPLARMFDALIKDDMDKFKSGMWTFLTIVGIYLPVRILEKYVYHTVTIKWRVFLTTQLMDKYFEQDNFYHLMDEPGLDNPGMRITDDVEVFVRNFLYLCDWQFGDGCQTIGYIVVLWYSIGFSVALIVSLYSLIGAVLLQYLFGRKLAHFTEQELADTAKFRGGLIQVKEYAESIAFCEAAEHEKHWALIRMHKMVNDMKGKRRWETIMESGLSPFKNASRGLHLLLLAPYMLGMLQWDWLNWEAALEDLGSRGNKSELLTLAAGATAIVTLGFFVMVNNFPKLSEVRASSHRIQELLKSLEERDIQVLRGVDHFELTPVEAIEEAGVPIIQDTLKLSDVCLHIPGTDNKLVQNLSFIAPHGYSLIIVGPSGVGKSSLLRAICGLWKISSGSISLPNKESLMFLPQNVYIPDIPLEENTLRGQLLFPHTHLLIDEKEMEQVIRSVNLHHLMGALGVYTCEDWRKRLSGGEKQRLAMARLLLAKPKVAFLDEATSALDSDNEQRLYANLQARGATYVSVGHKKELLKYHSYILELFPGGKWDLRPSEGFTMLTTSPGTQ